MRHSPAGLPALLLIAGAAACSKTEPTAEPDGDLVVRSGLTTVGWVSMVAAVAFVTLLMGFVAIGVTVTGGGELAESVRSRRYRSALGWLAFIPVLLGVAGLMGWGIYANTVFKYQTAVVTASRTTGKLTVERRRMLGADTVRAWKYRDIVRLDFDYVPSRSGDPPSPPMGKVYVVIADGSRSPVYDGTACVARELADAVASAGGRPLRVRSAGHDLAGGWGSLVTQLRCGIEDPFRPTTWLDYPAEAWRVLDVPFLWRWRWALPVAGAQLALVGVALLVIGRWRASVLRTSIMIGALVPVTLAVVALHIFTVRSYGDWPIILAVLALLSLQLVQGPLRKGRSE